MSKASHIQPAVLRGLTTQRKAIAATSQTKAAKGTRDGMWRVGVDTTHGRICGWPTQRRMIYANARFRFSMASSISAGLL
jgi:hypothetical protein